MVLALASAGVVPGSPIGVGAAAAQTVTRADLDRLEADLRDIQAQIDRVRRTRSDDISRYQRDLDDLEDELVYLRVKLRRERRVERSELVALRQQIDDLRTRIRGNVEVARSEDPYTVPVGTELDIRLQSSLDSDTAQLEDRFYATTVAPLYSGDEILIPAGSRIRGIVSDVDEATRTDRTSSLTLTFDQITVRGRSYPANLTLTEALEAGGLEEEAGRIGVGAGVGGVIGGILGGLKGALAGILIGAGGTVVATEGKNVELPAGTVLRVRFDSPLTIRPT